MTRGRASSVLPVLFLSWVALLPALLMPSGVHAADGAPSRLADPEVAVAQDQAWPQRVLITNDNGIEDVATQALARAFAQRADVVLVASAEDRSGSSNFMTFARTGRFVAERRDVGEGVPALAVSGVEDDDPEAVEAVVEWVLRLARSGIMEEIRPPAYLTVSLPVVPPSEITGIEVVERAHGWLSVSMQVEETASRESGKEVWSVELGTQGRPGPATDVAAVARKHLAVVPMRVGDEDPAILEWLRQREETLPAWRSSVPAPAPPPTPHR